MNALKKLTTPPWFALVLGVPAFALMAMLMASGLDERELFIPGHFAGILLWILTAAMCVLTFLSVRSYGGKTKYIRMFPASTPAAAGILGAALAVLASTWQIWTSNTDLLDLAVVILGTSSCVALVWLAWCRYRGTRGSFLLWSLFTAFLMLRLMLSYRTWSAEPELLRYCFPMLASACLTLAGYYRTAFSVGLGSRQHYLFFTQLSIFFCMTVLGNGFDLFYLGMLLWCALDLTVLRPFQNPPKESQTEEAP